MNIQELKKLKEKYEELRKPVEELLVQIKYLENDIELKAKMVLYKEFKEKFKLLPSFYIVKNADNFHISLKGYEGSSSHNNSITNYFHFFNGKFGKYSEDMGGWIFDERDPPIKREDVDKFVEDFNKNYEIKIHICEAENRINIRCPKTKLDIEAIEGEVEWITSGKIWYTGWDISDCYFVGRRKDGICVVYYSTDAHGGGCKKVPHKNLSKLENFIDYLKSNNVVENYEDIYNVVKSSWK